MGERETVNDEEVRPKEFEDIWSWTEGKARMASV